VNDVLARQKITFTPGSAEIDSKAGAVMTALADVLKDCPGVKMEVAGHTDSQGSEEGNRALSQARAESVILALQGRQVDVSGLLAKGYGEAVPLGENETDAGRESNRRIEFTLIGADRPVSADEAKAAEVAGASDAGAGADFSNDTSPSLAPKEKTRKPKRRPEKND
jgi:OOP family OmpA-OmpF porin